MSTLRSLFGILGGAAAGYIVGLCLVGLATPRGIGVAVAITAFCVIGIYACKAAEKDGRRARDKARHPSSWRIEMVVDHPVRVTTHKPDNMERHRGL